MTVDASRSSLRRPAPSASCEFRNNVTRIRSKYQLGLRKVKGIADRKLPKVSVFNVLRGHNESIINCDLVVDDDVTR